MILAVYLEIFIWVLVIYSLLDVILPLIIGKRPFNVMRSIFEKKKPAGGDRSGKKTRSNSADI